MPAESDANRLNDRLNQLEAIVNDLRATQASVNATQGGMKWAGAILIGALIAVVGVDLARVFALGDRVSEVQIDTATIATTMDFVSDDVSEIKADVKALRSDMELVARAVGAIEPKKASLSPE